MTALTIHARPTTYITRSGDRVHMRSRLEADFARYLDHCDVTWQYEPEVAASHRGQYLADFRAVHPTGAQVWYEVKPANWLTEHAAEVDGKLQQMAIIWDHHLDAYLVLMPWTYQATRPTTEWLLGSAGRWTRIAP